MNLLGTIEPKDGSVADRPEWIRLIDSHPDLGRSSDVSGINPFTKRPMIFKGNPDGAQVRVKSSVVGSIHCAMDGSRKLIVCSEVGAEVDVQRIAIDIATRLAWNFVTSDPEYHKAVCRECQQRVDKKSGLVHSGI